jgi:hypothetical protein
MKNVKRKIAAIILAATTLAVGTTGLSASAEEAIVDDYSILSVCDDSDGEIVLYSTSGSFSYNCTSQSPHKIGKVVASGTSIKFTFTSSTVGQAAIEVRTGSYTGKIVGTIITAAAGNTTTTLTSYVSVTKGTTYYIVVRTAGDYAQSTGSFMMTY